MGYFQLKALHAVKENYEIIMLHLKQTVSTGANQVTTVNRAKVKGVLSLLEKHHCFMLLLENMLQVLSFVSESLQENKIEMMQVDSYMFVTNECQVFV